MKIKVVIPATDKRQQEDAQRVVDFAKLARAKLHRLVITEGDIDRRYATTGVPALDALLGHPTKGVFGGQMIELRGQSSSGKSLLGADIAGKLVKLGSIAHWLDAETSWSDGWMDYRLPRRLVSLYQPYLGVFGGETEEDEEDGNKKKGKKKKLSVAEFRKRLAVARGTLLEQSDISPAEVLLQELEQGIKIAYEQFEGRHQIAVVDSIAALVPDEELQAGATDINMRSKLALATMLSNTLKRWMALMTQYNCTVLLLNQLRTNPAKAFGNPDYSPGGRAMEFYPHVRISLHRKSGFMTRNDQKIGIHGTAKSFKHKADGVEGFAVRYRVPFKGKAEYLAGGTDD